MKVGISFHCECRDKPVVGAALGSCPSRNPLSLPVASQWVQVPGDGFMLLLAASKLRELLDTLPDLN